MLYSLASLIRTWDKTEFQICHIGLSHVTCIFNNWSHLRTKSLKIFKSMCVLFQAFCDYIHGYGGRVVRVEKYSIFWGHFLKVAKGPKNEMQAKKVLWDHVLRSHGPRPTSCHPAGPRNMVKIWSFANNIKLGLLGKQILCWVRIKMEIGVK